MDLGRKLEIAIIGGGMMGLATAFKLSRDNIRVNVFEKDEEIGGLSRSDEILPGLRWDRYYHVILPTDEDLLEFIKELGLSDQVDFKETKTGFFTDGRIHSMSSTMEFLKFKPLSFANKIRLGLGILYASRLNNPAPLENTLAQPWLIKVFGRENYRKLWEPLLRSKLGAASSEISASFIWAYIHRLYGTRKDGSKKEMLGCVRGGYHSILNCLQEKISERGGKILPNHKVQKIEDLSNGKIRIYYGGGDKSEFDIVVACIPNPEVISMCPDLSDEYRSRLGKIRYLKLMCATLVLKKPLSPFYVMNLTDSGFPFTGLIEATHVIPPEMLGGKGLIYLPRYMAPDDPFYDKSNNEVLAIFQDALKRIFPEFSPKDVIGNAVHKEIHVQPIQALNYSADILPMETPLKNFYLVNTAMIRNSSLNNNQVIRLADAASKLIWQQTTLVQSN
jgi:protoporphyrinogen oxidase